MTLWIKARRGQSVVLVSVGVLGASAVAGSVVVPLPGLLVYQGLAVPAALLLPLAFAVTCGRALASGDPALERGAVRRIRRWDLAGVVAVTCLTAAAVAILGAPSSDLAIGAARNCLGFAGLMLLARPLTGSLAAPIVPAVFALICATFGGDVAGQARWWAWPVDATPDGRAIALALATFAAGLATTAFVPMPPRFGEATE